MSLSKKRRNQTLFPNPTFGPIFPQESVSVTNTSFIQKPLEETTSILNYIITENNIIITTEDNLRLITENNLVSPPTPPTPPENNIIFITENNFTITSENNLHFIAE